MFLIPGVPPNSSSNDLPCQTILGASFRPILAWDLSDLLQDKSNPCCPTDFSIGCFALPYFKINSTRQTGGRTVFTMQATTERVRLLASRHGHGNRPSGQSSTTTRITATTAKVMATVTMVCWLTT